MGCVITVHHPVLTPEEKAIRVEQIKKSMKEYATEAKKEEKQHVHNR
jgi:hypothetical protein